jgi:electron transfer flavoprotein-quinone oxidoreductase
MTTGMLAAETLVELKAAGKPFTRANLAAYKARLEESYVMKDLRKYRRMSDIFHNNKQFFNTYPDLLSRAAQTMIRVDGVDKKTKEREIKRSFVASRSLFGLIGDAYKFWRAVE